MYPRLHLLASKQCMYTYDINTSMLCGYYLFRSHLFLQYCCPPEGFRWNCCCFWWYQCPAKLLVLMLAGDVRYCPALCKICTLSCLFLFAHCDPLSACIQIFNFILTLMPISLISFLMHLCCNVIENRLISHSSIQLLLNFEI